MERVSEQAVDYGTNWTRHEHFGRTLIVVNKAFALMKLFRVTRSHFRH